MTTSLGEASHLERIVRLRGKSYVWNDEDQYEDIDTPDVSRAHAHGLLWQGAGHRANEVAEALRTALEALLDRWEGKGARAFEKKVRQVIYFAGMIAHQCDSTHPEPTKPEDYDEGSEGGGPEGPEAPSGSGNEEKSYYQVWEEIYEKLLEISDDDKNPGFPWTFSGNNFFMEADGDGFLNMAGLEYRVKNNDEDIWGDEAEEDVWEKYKECFGGSDLNSLVSAGKLKEEEGDGVWVFFWPNGASNMEKFYLHIKLNETENTINKEFAQALVDKYSKWPEQEPQPIQPPKLFSGDGGNGGNGGNGGMPGGGNSGIPGGGGSGMPGGGNSGIPDGPSTPETPDIPDRPDLEEDPNGPDIPNPNDPTDPNVPPDCPDDPNNPELPDQPDQPDTSDPNWPGPDRTPYDPGDPRYPGGPDGPGNENTGWPGQRDTGTETARTGGGGPGTISGGPGGGTIGGGPGGTGVPGGTGAGVAPGMAGGSAGAGGAGAGAGGMGAGAGGGAGRGGMGMMPMMGGGMGAGAGEGGNEGDRDTWLNEDDDVWGTDGDAPPPVLGGGL